jgi:hypothetical protein
MQILSKSWLRMTANCWVAIDTTTGPAGTEASEGAVTGNLGGGIYYAQGFESGLVLNRTMLSGNSAPIGREVFTDSGQHVTAGRFNLFGHNGSSGITGFSPETTDIAPSQPLSEILDTDLANNGGPTRTQAMVAGSPAIDAVNECTYPSLATD